MLNGPRRAAWLWLLGCGVIGLVTAFLFVWITEYYTESQYRPVQSIAKASLTGPATNIISGLAVGMETPALPVMVISAALLLSYYFGVQGLADVAGVSDYAKGIYGTAIATMGMLSCAAYILAMDTFGPITDNAGGIIEMSNQPEAIRDRTDKLDSAGNTTKALTKGYAIGSASLAAFLLFSAYLEEIKTIVTDKVCACGGLDIMPRGLELHEYQPGAGAGVCRGAAGRDADVPVQLAGDQGGGADGADGGEGCAGAVPGESGDHGGDVEAGLCAVREHRDGRGVEGDGAAGAAGGRAAGGGWADLPALQRELPGERGAVCGRGRCCWCRRSRACR